ncbi:hypothetical protein A9P82_12935 [Arachidicoccus ginsenosidimutans]|uniref:helix-turn-helix domain-containing protein n=1 Tax=Arachidicoccus sp. BS20 TaxID=1850526 RepID=UPI0007F17F24|nr:helix-turn-helix domain-containing protein [Arachidicoccus sp. BS20]ANI90108.1 hypothetical protein A9P82_12935 [Arachidicoccus sp. BS20]
MELDLVTKEDLQKLRMQIANDMRDILKAQKPAETNVLTGYKTAQVRKILGCSYNTLVALRVSRQIRTKKIGGALYYNKDDIRKLLEEGF